jgi:hypothetical protein
MIIQACGQSSREAINAVNGCNKLGIPWRFSRDVGDWSECHVGTVEFCEQAFGRSLTPDFYPYWLRDWWCRDIASGGGYFLHDRFCKPSWRYKIHEPRIYTVGEVVPFGWWASQVVKFVREWRYYIADGEVLAAGEYGNDDEGEEAPKLDIEWPAGFCGAVDFGRLDTGEIALVESHHPFACGWYGEASDCELYAMWLQLGWEYLLRGCGND